MKIAHEIETRLMNSMVIGDAKEPSLVLYNQIASEIKRELGAPKHGTVFFKTPMDINHLRAFCAHLKLQRGTGRPMDILHYYVVGSAVSHRSVI